MRVCWFWLCFINCLIDGANPSCITKGYGFLLLGSQSNISFRFLIFILWMVVLIFSIISLVLLLASLRSFLVLFSSFEVITHTIGRLLTFLSDSTLLQSLHLIFHFFRLSLLTLEWLSLQLFYTASCLICSEFSFFFASDWYLFECSIHVELHGFRFALGMIDNFILPYRHFFTSLKFRISHVELLINFTLAFDALYYVIDIEN